MFQSPRQGPRPTRLEQVLRAGQAHAIATTGANDQEEMPSWLQEAEQRLEQDSDGLSTDELIAKLEYGRHAFVRLLEEKEECERELESATERLQAYENAPAPSQSAHEWLMERARAARERGENARASSSAPSLSVEQQVKAAAERAAETTERATGAAARARAAAEAAERARAATEAAARAYSAFDGGKLQRVVAGAAEAVTPDTYRYEKGSAVWYTNPRTLERKRATITKVLDASLEDGVWEIRDFEIQFADGTFKHTTYAHLHPR
jgi:hypothetical protein